MIVSEVFHSFDFGLVGGASSCFLWTFTWWFRHLPSKIDSTGLGPRKERIFLGSTRSYPTKRSIWIVNGIPRVHVVSICWGVCIQRFANWRITRWLFNITSPDWTLHVSLIQFPHHSFCWRQICVTHRTVSRFINWPSFHYRRSDSVSDWIRRSHISLQDIAVYGWPWVRCGNGWVLQVLVRPVRLIFRLGGIDDRPCVTRSRYVRISVVVIAHIVVLNCINYFW